VRFSANLPQTMSQLLKKPRQKFAREAGYPAFQRIPKKFGAEGGI
jgi:hypothetical protein